MLKVLNLKKKKNEKPYPLECDWIVFFYGLSGLCGLFKAKSYFSLIT